MIVNDNSSTINKFETSVTDDARVVIYDCRMFIVYATGLILNSQFGIKYHLAVLHS
jgi:hypothetical protein